MLAFTERLVELLRSGQSFVLATVVKQEGSSPRDVGARMAVLTDGSIVGTIGGGAVEHRVMQLAPEVLASDKPQTLEFNLGKDLSMACGGGVWVLLEPIRPPDRAVLLGAGHISQHLCDMLARIGLEVWVLDSRKGFAVEERFPAARRLVERLSPKFVVEDAALTESDRRLYVVCVTNSHALDRKLVEQVLPLEHIDYVGMVGSRNKAKTTRRYLADNDMPQDVIDTLKSPLGLPLGGGTPAEIALSIAADIQAHRMGTAHLFSGHDPTATHGQAPDGGTDQ